MTLDQHIVRCKKTIQANLWVRNTRVFGSEMRHRRILQERRNQIRFWIIALRLALDPVTAPIVAEQLIWKLN